MLYTFLLECITFIREPGMRFHLYSVNFLNLVLKFRAKSSSQVHDQVLPHTTGHTLYHHFLLQIFIKNLGTSSWSSDMRMPPGLLRTPPWTSLPHFHTLRVPDRGLISLIEKATCKGTAEDLQNTQNTQSDNVSHAPRAGSRFTTDLCI